MAITESDPRMNEAPMRDSDDHANQESVAAAAAPAAEHRGDQPFGGGPASLIPVIVERPRDSVGVVWVRASRPALVPGCVFTARGRRWMITGLSPSGVTFACREAFDEAPR